jgi:catechol 2,3-dioxygenase-like lactoylglutathione lyase family enzyme
LIETSEWSKALSVTFINPVVFVKDIERSKEFYANELGLSIVGDHGSFVLFDQHFAIHQAHELAETVWGSDRPGGTDQDQGRSNLLLYFETETLEQTYETLKASVRMIHPIIQQPWGQAVFRFYDPDGHVIEIGEPLNHDG